MSLSSSSRPLIRSLRSIPHHHRRSLPFSSSSISSFSRSYHCISSNSSISSPSLRLSSSLFYSSPFLSSSYYRPFYRSLFIATQSTPNPNALKFLPGKPVLGGGSNTNNSNNTGEESMNTLEFTNYRQAQSQSPLAQALFQIDGVSSVLLSSDFITVSITDGSDWLHIKPHVYAAITDFYASGKPAVVEKTEGESNKKSDTTIEESDDDTVALIKELIETRIRPSVQEDGGDIFYKGFNKETGIVLVQLAGSCRGCSSSTITLKNGIENMLQHYVPEVNSVEQWKDEEMETVSEEQLKKLEERLANVKEGGNKE